MNSFFSQELRERWAPAMEKLAPVTGWFTGHFTAIMDSYSDT